MSDISDKTEDQAKLLVALQDLDLMIKEAEDQETSSELKEMGFPLDNVTALRQARDELAQRVQPQLLNRYERVSKNYERPVVPVTGELCLGCFAKIPTSFRSLHERARILTCENCGRILYFT
jgi:predicted  nucleic acid-binding Zn-ribbon protein